MYFVRGVAGIFRKSTTSSSGDSLSKNEIQAVNVNQTPSWPELHFSNDGEEGNLESLWQLYQEASNQVEAKTGLEAFLNTFVQTYDNWIPENLSVQHQSSARNLNSIHEEQGSAAVPGVERVGETTTTSGNRCTGGHPTKVVVGLIQELKVVTHSITDLHSMTDVVSEMWVSQHEMEVALCLLNALNIIVRSAHNRRIFYLFGGVQNLMSLMKAAVVKLKGVTGVISAGSNPPLSAFTQMQFLQSLVMHIVSIVTSYLEIDIIKHGASLVDEEPFNLSSGQGEIPLYLSASRSSQMHQVTGGEIPTQWPLSCESSPGLQPIFSGGDSDNGFVISLLLLESGGLNWFVELLRILRRLHFMGVAFNASLDQSILQILRATIMANPRSQNHFRTIGGLEVLMDGLGGLPVDTVSEINETGSQQEGSSPIDIGRMLVDFQLQILSLQVLREASFRNVASLQYLRDHGGIKKISQMITFAAYSLPEMVAKLQMSCKISTHPSSSHLTCQDRVEGISALIRSQGMAEIGSSEQIGTIVDRNQRRPIELPLEELVGYDDLPGWNRRVADLCRILSSFIVTNGDVRSFAAELAKSKDVTGVSGAYWDLAASWVVNVLLGLFTDKNEKGYHHNMTRLVSSTLQHYVLFVLKKMLEIFPNVLQLYHDEGILEVMFSKYFFYFGLDLVESQSDYYNSTSILATEFAGSDYTDAISGNRSGLQFRVLEFVDTEPLRLEVISFVELAATVDETLDNLPECRALFQALQMCSLIPSVAMMLIKSLHRILQLALEPTVKAFHKLDAITVFSLVMERQMETFAKLKNGSEKRDASDSRREYKSVAPLVTDLGIWQLARESLFTLYTEYCMVCEDVVIECTHNLRVVDAFFNFLFEPTTRSFGLQHIMMFMKLPPKTEEDQDAKMELCRKYFESLPRAQVQCRETGVSLLISLLSGVREVLQTDLMYYQAMFREGECFVHIVSLLNDDYSEDGGLQLSLDVVRTLTRLLEGNQASKVAFRGLVGIGYKTLQNLLVEQYQGCPSKALLLALLDMLVDGNFLPTSFMLIQNEDAILLFFNILLRCNIQEQCSGLDTFQCLLDDSTANRASCEKAGLLTLVLNWFADERHEILVLKLGQLVQTLGGHSISGKDMRKIFALLRDGRKPNHSLCILNILQKMLTEDGPAVFFDMSGKDSGIVLTTPLQWPANRGYTFSCWIRVQSFPTTSGNKVDVVGLFSFLSESGKGCTASLRDDQLIMESVGVKRQTISLRLDLPLNSWSFICISHSTGRALTGGNFLKVYLDGALVNSDRLRYPKVNEPLIRCTIAASSLDKNLAIDSASRFSAPFCGQLGSIYLFDDILSADQVQGLYSLGVDYMYSCLSSEAGCAPEKIPSQIITDARDTLSSAVIFGYNAQASAGRFLFDISPVSEQNSDYRSHEATIMGGTLLCNRHLAQDSIISVGGVTVFYPLLTLVDQYLEELGPPNEKPHVQQLSKERWPEERKTEKKNLFSSEVGYVVEVIELVTAFLAKSYGNQQYMQKVSGFSVLAFLLQSVSPQHLTVQVVSALEHMLTTISNSSTTHLNTSTSGASLAESLVKEVLLQLYLNPHIWILTPFGVQRALYMSLLNLVENDARNLRSVCDLPRILDVVQQFYVDKPKKQKIIPVKLNPGRSVCDQLSKQEVAKIRLLVLCIAERILRDGIYLSDSSALVALIETSDDATCLEDVLHMILGLLAHKQFLVTFAEHISTLGGYQVFVSVLSSQQEAIRLLGLRIIGALLVRTPAEKKTSGLFSGGGGFKLVSEQHAEKIKLDHLFCVIRQKVLMFPFTDLLRATLFDFLLGGVSLKQALQIGSGKWQSKHVRQNSEKDISSATFALPRVLGIIFGCVVHSNDLSLRLNILEDVLRLLEANPLNIESLILETHWQEWFFTVLLAALKRDEQKFGEGSMEKPWLTGVEQFLVRKLLCVVHVYCVFNLKGGCRHVGRTVNLVYVYAEQGKVSKFSALCAIMGDLMEVVMMNTAQIFNQPCRDNLLHLLSLIEELILPDNLHLPLSSNDILLDENSNGNVFLTAFGELSLNSSLRSGSRKATDYAAAEELNLAASNQGPSPAATLETRDWQKSSSNGKNIDKSQCWKFYEKVWSLVLMLNGRSSGGGSFLFPTSAGPSLSQRARVLVESINIPASEIAAAVVAGGLGVVGISPSSKFGEKAFKIRGERYPRVIFQLLLCYLYEADLEAASQCAQRFLTLLPGFVSADADQNKNRLHFFLWMLLEARSQIGSLDNGARFHIVSQLVRDTVEYGKSMLASTLTETNASQEEHGMSNECAVHRLVQQDRVLAAVKEESRYFKSAMAQRLQELELMRSEWNEAKAWELQDGKFLDEQNQSAVSVVCANDMARQTTFHLLYSEERQAISDHWWHLFRSLINERGPWATIPFPSKHQVRWKLDKVEDPWRRRLKLKCNCNFIEEFCHPSAQRSVDETITEATTNLGAESILGSVKTLTFKGIREICEEDISEQVKDGSIIGPEFVADGEISIEGTQSKLLEHTRDGDVIDDSIDHLKVSSIFPAGDLEVLVSASCMLVSPERKIAGTLELRQSSVHFYGEFMVEGTGGKSVFDGSCSLNHPESRVFATPEKGNKSVQGFKYHKRWDVFQIKELHATRYLLQYTALEIFFYDSIPPLFLNFPSEKHVKNVSSVISSLRGRGRATKMAFRDKENIVYIDKRKALDLAERAKDSWRRREMTNFDYLMTLNTLGGRSYNDLTQYPIFPWILADYSSEKLNLSNPASFRDLSKPVGALNPKRFQVFAERYQSFSDPDIPSFYYGSHYSTMGIVLFYLLRLEPFTLLHRHLQGGKLDHADRLFHSIGGTYANCLTNSSDVKELVPEFFYMPEFLINSNDYFLGIKQDGEQLGNVILPPWAKGSAEEFVHLNREALESEYVSDHLHEWIDLIFGYKQRGRPALEAANVFYHLTYEGAVDLEALESPLEQAAVEDQIANFGQTPIQLFRRKHQKRGLAVPVIRPLYYAPASITLTSCIQASQVPLSGQQNMELVYVALVDGKVISVTRGLTVMVRLWLTPLLQGGGSFTFSSLQDPFYGIGPEVTLARKIAGTFVDGITVNSHNFSTLQIKSLSFLLLCGQWDNSFRVFSLSDGRLLQNNFQHKDVVNCISVAVDGSVVVTGSRDTTVMVWEVNMTNSRRPGATRDVEFTSSKRALVRGSSNQHDKSSKVDSIIISHKPRHILCGHDDSVTCVAVRVELDLVVSGSMDSSCIFHTLYKGRYVRSLGHPNGCPISKLALSQHGRVVIFSEDDLNLHLFSINGKYLGVAESNGRLNCMELSGCGEFLICGGDHGQIVVRMMHSLDVVRRYDGNGAPITSLTVTPDGCFLAGTLAGDLLVFSIEVQQQRKGNLFFSSLRTRT